MQIIEAVGHVVGGGHLVEGHVEGSQLVSGYLMIMRRWKKKRRKKKRRTKRRRRGGCSLWMHPLLWC